MTTRMRRRKIFNYIIIVFFVSFSNLSLGKEIKVGYLDFKNFIIYEEDGFKSGYAGEIFNNLETISKEKYKFIKGSREELQEKLDNKKIDLMLVERKNKKSLEKYDYSELDIGVSRGVLYALPDSSYYYEDFSEMKNKKIGFYSYSLIEDLKEYLGENKVLFESKRYHSKEKLLEALKNKEVDLIVLEYMNYENGLNRIGEFPARLLFAVSLKNSNIMDNFDKNYEKLFMKKYNMRSYLYEKYYKSKIKNNFLLTKEETNYLKNLEEITVAVRNIKPLNWEDPKTKEPVGLYINALKEIGKFLNLKINFKLISEKKRKEEILNEYDYFLDSFKELSKDKGKDLKQDSIFNINYVYIKDRNKKSNINKEIKIGILNTHKKIGEKILKENKNYKLYFFENIEEIADAVVYGKIDRGLINEIKIAYLFKNLKYKDLTTIYLEEINGSLKLVSKKNNHLLQSAINKVIDHLGSEKIYRIALSNLNINDNSLLISNFFKIYGSRVVIILLMIFLIFLIFYIIQRNKIYEKLAIAKREEEIANKAKSNFLESISHDMKTPMNSIIGMSNFGLEECCQGECKSYFEQIKKSSNYLLNLLNDILDLQNIENNKLTLEFEELELGTFLDEIYKGIEFKVKEKNIDFVIENKTVEKYIKADKKRLKQIIINILDNALKYTSYGGKIIWKNTFEIIDENKGIYTCIIEDNGKGIGKEFQDKLMYKDFTQEYNNLLNKKSGAGVGLSITKKLIDKMDGEIRCLSYKNKGTKFIIDISFYISKNINKIKLEDSEKRIKKCLDGKRILVCEDIEINRVILGKILSSLGILVEEAENGEIALQMVKSKKYNAILMDIRMPVMGGLEAAEKIREFNKEIPIIAISANTYKEDVKKSLEAGMNGHLGKPLEKEKLHNILKELLCDKKI